MVRQLCSELFSSSKKRSLLSSDHNSILMVSLLSLQPTDFLETNLLGHLWWSLCKIWTSGLVEKCDTHIGFCFQLFPSAQVSLCAWISRLEIWCQWGEEVDIQMILNSLMVVTLQLLTTNGTMCSLVKKELKCWRLGHVKAFCKYVHQPYVNGQ